MTMAWRAHVAAKQHQAPLSQRGTPALGAGPTPCSGSTHTRQQNRLVNAGKRPALQPVTIALASLQTRQRVP